jgi:hypothetical protein
MSYRLVWITATADPLTLSCGHTNLGNGYPTERTHEPRRGRSAVAVPRS